jgi:oxygen-independent coproporphyrinogen-3 oxidase
VKSRIAEWIELPDEAHRVASHGFVLDAAEQRRRFVMLSLLDAGVDRAAYSARFGVDVLDHFPELEEAFDLQLASHDSSRIRLTELGLERSDVLGYWLQSNAVRSAREAWEPV